MQLKLLIFLKHEGSWNFATRMHVSISKMYLQF